MNARARTRTLSALCAFVALLPAACSGDDDSDSSTATSRADTTTQPAPSTTADGATSGAVFNGQGNDLAAYTLEPPFTKQVVIPHHDDSEQPDGLDINGQICFDPANPRRFVAGEDTRQSTTGEPGWGIFELEGEAVGELSARQIGKLVPTYQSAADNAENYGCGFLADGRIVTTDIGNQAAGTGNGQLIVWFPPFEGERADDDTFPPVAHCKVDIALTTGQGVLVDGDSVYVAQARRPGVFRYDATAFPTGPTAAEGCDATDATGAPMASGVTAELFIEPAPGNSIATPAAIAKAPSGNLYVSSVFNGVIAEFTPDGTFVRDILRPPAGEQLGAQPFSTGTPLGIGVGPDGSLYVADIGIVVDDGIGPGSATGTVRRIRFDANGDPQAPETMDEGLAFPDGIGVFVP